MRSKSALATAVLAAVLSTVQTVQAGGFFDERPFLAQRSSWSETVTGGEDPAGWWAVGNSRVFGIVGPGLASAEMHQITGPHIMLAGVMADGSAFGPSTFALTVGGKPVVFKQSTLSRVRGTDIVLMELVADDVTMTVVNYAPFGMNAMLRTVVVKNTGKAPIEAVLTGLIGRAVVKDGFAFDTFKGGDGAKAMGQTRQLFGNFIEPAEVTAFDIPARQEAPAMKGVALKTNLGAIPGGAEAVRTQYLAFSMKETPDEAATIAAVKAGGVNLLQKTADDWKGWLAQTTTLQCADSRLVDLIDDTKIIVKIQTAEPQGAAGPMEFFAGTWVRDSNGPFLYYCRMGQLEAARKMLNFFYSGAVQNTAIPNFLPMDIDVTKPIDPNIDWTRLKNDPVEITNWLVMQHKRYVQYTGDLTPVREHWGFLKKCLMGQLTNDKGEPIHYENYATLAPGANTLYRFPHHGDETWIYPGFEVLNSSVFPEPCDHVSWDQYSADSTWEFVVTADTLADFAQKIGRPAEEIAEIKKIAADGRAACERDYWMGEKNIYAPAMSMRSKDLHQVPFTMVNLNPLWIDYLKPEDPKAVSNVLETMKYTMNPNFVTDATETLKVYVGMEPGMFLYNLAAIDHPYAEAALQAMVNVAAPSGEYTEKQVTEPTSYKTSFLGHRIRPWEGGINMDAAFYYLTGLKPSVADGRIQLCPRMPTGWKQMSVTGQKLADGALDIVVADDGARRTYTLKLTGTKPLTADFKVSLPQSKISAVKVNGQAVAATPGTRWGVTTARFDVALSPNQPVVVTAEYTREAAEPIQFARERFKYVAPKDVQPVQVVLWDAEARKNGSGKPEDARTFDLLNGKVTYRLITACNPASADWIRPFLLKADGTLNAPVFFLTPNSIFSMKYSKWWGDPELTKLFTEYMTAGGVIMGVSEGDTSSETFGKLFGDSGYYTIPMGATPVAATDGGKGICDTLGLLEVAKTAAPADPKAPVAKPQAGRMFAYKNMIVLARPEPEPTAAVIMAKRFGKGFFLTTLVDLNYEQRAALIGKLVQPATVAALATAIDAVKPESVADAFKDFAKDGAFSDDFKSYKEGGVGLPVWLPTSGIWKMQGGELHELTNNGYDFVATANAKVKGDYVIESTSRLVEGIYETGFVFNLPTRFEVTTAQMVRFCGGPNLWCGPIPFSLEHEVPTGIATDKEKEFHTLKVTVRNSKGTYDLEVDGKVVAKDYKLTNVLKEGQSGYVGLVSCRGHVAYKSFTITPLK